MVVAAGGDGTLNAVIEGLAGSETVLGVLPTGTMNVFARELGIPYDKLDLALEVMDEENFQEVDLFEMNGAPFVQMAGVGFDARVIEETTWKSKKRFGPLAYAMTAARLVRVPPPPLRITTAEGEEIEGVSLLVGNGSLYGGQFPLFRQAKNSDRLLDVVIFQGAGFQFIRDCAASLLKGGIDLADSGESLKYVQTAGLKVECEEGVPAELDGELWGRDTVLEFAHSNRTLKVCAPKVRRVKLRYAILKSLVSRRS